MKKILQHFRISLLLGLTLLGCYGCQIAPHATIRSAHLDQGTSSQENTPSDNPNPDTPVNPGPPEEPDESFKFTTDLIIKAVNPGYTIDGTQNVGEFIEIQKIADNLDFSLAGYGIRYTNSSGKTTLLLGFSEGSLMTGETLLVRLARSPDSDRADATYMTTLAMTNGRVELIYQDQVIDQICWGSGEGCAPSFKSAKPTTLLRNFITGNFEHSVDYEPSFDPAKPSLILPPQPEVPEEQPSSPGDNATETTARCYELEFSEILTYYANAKTEQFVELYNPSDKTVVMNQCALRYKKKTYYLSGEIAADSYYAYYPAPQTPSFSLTKNPNSSNTIELLDTNGTVVDTLVYNHGQKKSTSYAKFYTANGEEVWDSTYAPTPSGANVYQEFRTCPEGKIINPDTGNCINVASSSKTTSTVCPEGKYLNPLTGRCKKIPENSNTPKPCAAGYERNPETNRCRKIKSKNDGATHALVPNTSSSKSVFIAIGAVILVVSLGVIYIILQFRHEIARTARKAIQRLNHIRKDLITRRIGFHRNKKP